MQDWVDSEVVEAWEKLESAGLARLAWKPDEHVCYEDLTGDCFDLDKHPKTPGGERTLHSEEREFREKIERDGVWGLTGEYRLRPCTDCNPWGYEECRHEGWQTGDGVWGFVGQEACDYDLGIQRTTIAALVDALKDQRPSRS